VQLAYKVLFFGAGTSEVMTATVQLEVENNSRAMVSGVSLGYQGGFEQTRQGRFCDTAPHLTMTTGCVTVLFFARGRELAGVSQIAVQLQDAADTKQLLKYVLNKYPKLSEIVASTVLSLNQEYLDLDQSVPLKNGDEVAVIPPVSGG
jgi:molybdopterin converting factor subunit 1